VPPETLNLAPGSSLLTSLKQCVVELAKNSNVLETVQRAAQGVLKGGWMILLPTVSERATALSSLLPSGEGEWVGGGVCVWGGWVGVCEVCGCVRYMCVWVCVCVGGDVCGWMCVGGCVYASLLPIGGACSYLTQLIHWFSSKEISAFLQA